MITILAGLPASFPVTLQRNGAAVAIASGSTVTARLFSADGMTPLSDQVTQDAASSWADGEVTVTLGDTETSVPAGEAMLVVASTSPALTKRFAVRIETAGDFERSALFVKDIAVDQLRADSLMMAASGAFTAVDVSDDYLWAKLRAAESEIAHELRVPLVPTYFFPDAPTDAELADIGGKPWAIDPGYDYKPEDFGYNDRWGFIRLRNKPLHSVSRVRFAYPGGPTAHYDLPLDWIRPDKKYGQIQFVPSSTAFAAPLNAFVMQAIGQGRTIPLAIQISYLAGLADVRRNYPELIDAILKKAVVKVVEDAFLPQSGSISADGLSQSISNDMDKHRDTVERIINGEKGTNGGLMTAIHGVRLVVA